MSDALPILDAGFWHARLLQARAAKQLHHAVFRCPGHTWDAIAARHREILAALVKPGDSVLDVGCGWGRLLELMPKGWWGDYCGVDLSPDFIAMARERYPDRRFILGDVRKVQWDIPGLFQWGVLVSVRPMVRRNLGDAAWLEIEKAVRSNAVNLLYLEYNSDCAGSVE